MDNFKLNTSMIFPFFKIEELVKYAEVKKPSGVAYILLVLISESKNKSDRLANVLINFGIPKNLHYIFADTIQYLIDQDILENFNFYKSEFENYLIGSFQFTTKGKKIFAEESIPTGINKEIKIPVFYNIALNELSLKIDNDLEPKPLMDCAITPEFMSKFKCTKDIEGFLNLKKGNGIGIKKEEIITNVEALSQDNWIARYDCEMRAKGDNIEIKFEDLTLQKFFNDNFTNSMISQTLAYKNKFKFKSSFSRELKLSNYDYDKIDNVLLPKDLDDIVKQKCQLFYTNGNYKNNNSYQIVFNGAFKDFDSKVEFLQVDMHDNVYGYIPGEFIFDSSFGDITIPLVIKYKYTDNEFKNIIGNYIKSNLLEYKEDNFKELVKITKITDDFELAEQVLLGYLNKDCESNIVILNEVKQYAISNAGVLNIYKKYLEINYNEYFKTVTEDNLSTFLKITSSIPKFLNIASKIVLENIFDKIKVKDTVKLYELLVEKGFDKELVLTYLNPVETALESRNVNDKSLLDLINYFDAIDDMKNTTGINDFKQYTYDEENINHSDFKTNYNKAYNLKKSVQIFRNNNESLFSNYDGFMNLFSVINDDINLVESALKNPNNLKLDLIEKKISNGEYQFVFVNLSAKLETILKNNFKLEGKLSDMLNDARSNGIIDKKIVSDLHDFRDNRNAFVHPEDRVAKYDANDLRRWAKEIFDLEGDKE